MKLIRQSHEFLTELDSKHFMRAIELVARTCYKSEDKIGEGTAEVLVNSLVARRHGAMIEHAPSVSIKFITDRGITHELVRHRLASFAQESTRYCNYSKGKFDGELTFIVPPWVTSEEVADPENDVDRCDVTTLVEEYEHNSPAWEWLTACKLGEIKYLRLLAKGWKPEHARSVLPNSIKADIVVTANLREWMHICTLRTERAAHPQMRDLMLPVLNTFKQQLPLLFNHIPGE